MPETTEEQVKRIVGEFSSRLAEMGVSFFLVSSWEIGHQTRFFNACRGNRFTHYGMLQQAVENFDFCRLPDPNKTQETES